MIHNKDDKIIDIRPGDLPDFSSQELKESDFVYVWCEDLEAGIELGINIYRKQFHGDVFVVFTDDVGSTGKYPYNSDVFDVRDKYWMLREWGFRFGRPIVYLYINWLESKHYAPSIFNKELTANIYVPVSRRSMGEQVTTAEYLKSVFDIPLTDSRRSMTMIAKRNSWGRYAPVYWVSYNTRGRAWKSEHKLPKKKSKSAEVE